MTKWSRPGCVEKPNGMTQVDEFQGDDQRLCFIDREVRMAKTQTAGDWKRENERRVENVRVAHFVVGVPYYEGEDVEDALARALRTGGYDIPERAVAMHRLANTMNLTTIEIAEAIRRHKEPATAIADPKASRERSNRKVAEEFLRQTVAGLTKDATVFDRISAAESLARLDQE